MENLAFAEELYARFLADPVSVPLEWRRRFKVIKRERWSPPSRGPTFGPSSIFNPPTDGGFSRRAAASDDAVLQEKLDHLIRAYRVRGHMIADVDPLGRPRVAPPELDSAFFGLTESDLERPVSDTTIPGAPSRTVGGVLDHLRKCYCGTLGVEYMHIGEINPRRWLQERLEAFEPEVPLERHLELGILERLTDAVIFEEVVQKKFVGTKSFSLEGAESLIPLLHLAIERAAHQGLEEIVLAMAHRGRLNVLANILEKDATEIFREFEDADPLLHLGGGDVKYHLGYSTDWTSAAGHKVHLSLCFNPSHLEYINPVALGRMRAKQDVQGDHDRSRGMVILMHGDASFAGEGVIQETLNLSELEGYRVGGTLHVIINNQIGFTTTPDEATSSPYHTGVAKMLSSPIFHVNGEDPEAVARVIAIAMDYRAHFKRDVFVDMYCYRRRGHNEADEPSFTQPLLYKAIKKRSSVRDAYLDRLLKRGGVTREEAASIVKKSRDRLEHAFEGVKRQKLEP
jgi:2-oxoglutarate dehydrogenase E1 component